MKVILYRKIYPEFYERLVTEKTKGWDGNPRKKQDHRIHAQLKKQNYKIPLSQFRIVEWRSFDVNLGFKMLEIGKKYGPNSDAFLNALAYLILVNGNI